MLKFMLRSTIHRTNTACPVDPSAACHIRCDSIHGLSGHGIQYSSTGLW